MRDNFFSIVRRDKATTDDYDKTNKWTRNKVDKLAESEIKEAIKDLEYCEGDFCYWCKGAGCEMCGVYDYDNSHQEYEWLDEWLDDGKGIYFHDDQNRPTIKVGG